MITQWGGYLELLTEVSIDSKGRVMLPVDMRKALMKRGVYKLSLKIKMDERGIEIKAIPITQKTFSIRLVLRNEPGALARLFGIISDARLTTVDATVETLGGGESLKCFVTVASDIEIDPKDLSERLLDYNMVREAKLISGDSLTLSH